MMQVVKVRILACRIYTHKRTDGVMKNCMRWTGRLECIPVMEKFITVEGWGMDGEFLTIPQGSDVLYVSPGELLVKDDDGKYFVEKE